MKPQVVAHELGKRLADNAIVATDSGTITAWAARHIPIRGEQMFSLSGNLATMACALPYAIGAQLAYPDRQVIAFAGDGGVSMLMAELATAVKGMRDMVAERYRAAVVDTIRFARPELAVLAHASPQAHRYAAFTGMDATRAGLFDGLVVNCWQGTGALTATVAASDVPVLASLLAVDGMGGRPDTLAEQGVAALAAGAAGLRIYHAGLAGDAGLEHIRELTATVAKGADQ